MTPLGYRFVSVVVLVALAAGCASSDGSGEDSAGTDGASDGTSVVPTTRPDAGAGGTAPGDRAVTITTTACGDASATTGSGVILDQALVLTAGHVVVGATDVLVDEEPATVFLLDRTRDLALLKAPSVDATRIELADVESGDQVRVVGGARSGTVAASVERLLVMDVDDVRDTSRSTRAGYELDAAIAGGDSGAGVFDGDDRLVGIVFAVPTARSAATFAVDDTEIAAVLAATDVGEHRCDPARSQLAGPGSTAD